MQRRFYPPTTIKHNKVEGKLYLLLAPVAERHSCHVAIGRTGFKGENKVSEKVFSMDLGVYTNEFMTTIKDEHEVFSEPPVLLIEILSEYNYSTDGMRELNKKINKVLQNRDEGKNRVIWVLHPGVRNNLLGVEVLTQPNENYNPRYPTLLPTDSEEILADGGLSLEIRADSVLKILRE